MIGSLQKFLFVLLDTLCDTFSDKCDLSQNVIWMQGY